MCLVVCWRRCALIRYIIRYNIELVRRDVYSCGYQGGVTKTLFSFRFYYSRERKYPKRKESEYFIILQRSSASRIIIKEPKDTWVFFSCTAWLSDCLTTACLPACHEEDTLCSSVSVVQVSGWMVLKLFWGEGPKVGIKKNPPTKQIMKILFFFFFMVINWINGWWEF